MERSRRERARRRIEDMDAMVILVARKSGLSIYAAKRGSIYGG